MIGRVLTFCAAFLTGATVWLALNVVNAINPFLNWEYPFLRLFMGMTFPGGAPLSLYFLSHATQTWVPFIAAFLVSYALTRRKARFFGAVAMYVAFLVWSLGMVMLHTLLAEDELAASKSSCWQRRHLARTMVASSAPSELSRASVRLSGKSSERGQSAFHPKSDLDRRRSERPLRPQSCHAP